MSSASIRVKKRSASRDRNDPGKVLLINGRTGRRGIRLDAGKYLAVRRAILKSVPRAPRQVGFSALIDLVRRNLPAGEVPGGGSIPWYLTHVKLDLEARGELVCDRDRSPQMLSRPGNRRVSVGRQSRENHVARRGSAGS